MPQIVSTMSTGVDYVLYEETAGGSGARTAKHVVSVKGGAGVARGVPGAVRTADGIVTHVSDRDLEALKLNDVFKRHLEGGHIKIIESEREVKVDKATGDMKKKDASAPLDDSDFKAGGRAAGAILKKPE